MPSEARHRKLAAAPEYDPDEIQEKRIAVGLTQQGLADVAGVSKASVQFWESDDYHDPSPANALTLQRIFEAGPNPTMDEIDTWRCSACGSTVQGPYHRPPRRSCPSPACGGDWEVADP